MRGTEGGTIRACRSYKTKGEVKEMKSLKKHLAYLFALMVTGTLLVMPVMADVLTLTVYPGRPAVASGRVNNDDHRYYEVYLSKKHSLLIEIEGAATFDLVSRQGKTIATGTTNWEDSVPADGWYDITVKTDGGSQAYKLTVTAYQTTPPTAASGNSNQSSGAAPATPPKTVQNDLTGAYFPAGDLPDDFSEINFLALATLDENGNPAPLNGFIRPKRRSAKDYRIVNLRLNGNEISFSTTRVGKVNYSFRGKFEVMGNFSENPPPDDKIVLRGELLKMVDGGAPVAGANVAFTYSKGG